MLRYLTLLLLFLRFEAPAQAFQKDDGTSLFVLSEVVSADSTSKDQLFSKINEWFAITYNSANNVVQLKDSENGKIIGKGLLQITPIHRRNNITTPVPLKVSYTISVIAKDNRFKYEMSLFQVKSDYGDFPLENYSVSSDQIQQIPGQNQKIAQETMEYQKQILEQTETQAIALGNSLKAFVKKSAHNDDW